MSNSPASLGVQAQWGFGAANPVTVPCELGPGGDQLKATRSRVMTEGLRGTRQRIHETTGDGMITIAGDVEIIPTYTPLAAMFPFIMGGVKTGSSNPYTYPFAETNQNYGSGTQGFYVTSDRKAKVFTYTGVNVSKAVFSVQQGQALKCVLSLVAQTETIGNAGTFPSLTYPTDSPFMWSSGVFTFNSVARSVKDCTITIDNHPITDLFYNSQTATQFPFQDFTVTVEVTTPFTADEVDLYNVALGSDVTGSIAFTDTDATGGPGNAAAHTLTFNFGKLDWPAETPVVAGRGEIPSKIKFTSRKVTQGTATDCLSISM
jgi:hypothetical protein